MDTSEDQDLRPDEIELRTLATRERVPGLRALAADMAMRQDYDLDTIDDLRLIVDEICAILLAGATGTDTLTVRLLIDPGRIEIGASIALPGHDEPAVKPLSVRILQTLSDVFDCDLVGEGEDRVLRLSFVKSLDQAASA